MQAHYLTKNSKPNQIKKTVSAIKHAAKLKGQNWVFLYFPLSKDEIEHFETKGFRFPHINPSEFEGADVHHKIEW